VPSPTLRAQWAPHLEQLPLQVVEWRIEADLRRARYEGVLQQLRDLIALHPLRERFHGRLTIALAGTGRRAEALDVYRQARRILVDELGVEPGPELRRLQPSPAGL
jgi:DNA-binding SARP family transcriptional activator